MRYEIQGQRSLRRKVAADNLKKCPLCGALNADTNRECFVCTWTGAFDRDQESVGEALDYLIERCPELASEFPAPKPPTHWQRAKLWLARTFLRY